jgi:hypothetical protein
MSRVEWAVLCDLAYFDAYRNLCLIGVQTQPVPTLSVGTRRFAIAARIPGLRERPAVAVALSTPGGADVTVCGSVEVEAVGEFLVIALSAVPLGAGGGVPLRHLGDFPGLSLLRRPRPRRRAAEPAASAARRSSRRPIQFGPAASKTAPVSRRAGVAQPFGAASPFRL